MSLLFLSLIIIHPFLPPPLSPSPFFPTLTQSPTFPLHTPLYIHTLTFLHISPHLYIHSLIHIMLTLLTYIFTHVPWPHMHYTNILTSCPTTFHSPLMHLWHHFLGFCFIAHFLHSPPYLPSHPTFIPPTPSIHPPHYSSSFLPHPHNNVFILQTCPHHSSSTTHPHTYINIIFMYIYTFLYTSLYMFFYIHSFLVIYIYVFYCIYPVSAQCDVLIIMHTNTITTL